MWQVFHGLNSRLQVLQELQTSLRSGRELARARLVWRPVRSGTRRLRRAQGRSAGDETEADSIGHHAVGIQHLIKEIQHVLPLLTGQERCEQCIPTDHIPPELVHRVHRVEQL